jgi:hypothetical protein
LFSSEADRVARETGFIQRERGYGGAEFVRTLVFGWIDDKDAPIEEFAEQLGVTASAVQQRLTERCVNMMRCLLECACTFLMAAQPEHRELTELTKRFSAIYVEDCTSIPLLESLSHLFPGCGGAEAGQGAAGCKALVRMEVTSGALSVLKWDRARENDLNLSRSAGDVPAGSLSLADLGFWCPQRLNHFTRQGISWISRVPAGTTLAGTDCRRPERREKLSAFLARQKTDRVDQQVLLGEKAFCFRLVAVRCPPHLAEQKKRKLRKKAKKRGRQVSGAQLTLCEWLVLVTSLSAEAFSAEELWVLYRVRWQIELVFKRWKSVMGLGHSRARTNGSRQLVELYAKLLGCLVTHWGSLLRAGLLTKLSPHKILKRVKQALGTLKDLKDLGDPSSRQQPIQAVLEQLARRLNRLKPRTRRKKKPGTMELLENPEIAFN